MVRMILGAALAALVAMPTVAEAGVATGCLTRSGRIVKVAVGGQPARPCGPRQTEITLQLGEEQEPTQQLVPFFLTMQRDGPDQTIATNGPLELFARCSTPDTGGSLHEILVVSEFAGAWVSTFLLSNPLDAGQEGRFSSYLFDVEETPRYIKGSESNFTDAYSVVAPGGYYIAVEPNTLGLGNDILGHDCIFVGTAILIRGVLE